MDILIELGILAGYSAMSSVWTTNSFMLLLIPEL